MDICTWLDEGLCSGTELAKECAGTGVDVLPWSEMDSLQLETGYIKEQLVSLNRRGFLTINSQPRVNGAPSTDPKVGWGGPNGSVLSRTQPVSSQAFGNAVHACSILVSCCTDGLGSLHDGVLLLLC